MSGAAGAVRLTVVVPPGAGGDERLEEALDALTASWVEAPGGRLHVWVSPDDAATARDALASAGLPVEAELLEPPRDWIAESAALRRAVAVGELLLDPHDGPLATAAGSRRRLHLPAERAFGTGSHESTRLALRLLRPEVAAGRRVLDVGCGAGTLALAARVRGASWAAGLDIDVDAPFAARANARRNGVAGAAFLAGPVEALGAAARFDLVVANMLQEEVVPLLPGLARLVAPAGELVTSGQLAAREEEFLGVLRAHGFRPVELASEGEWLASRSTRG